VNLVLQQSNTSRQITFCALLRYQFEITLLAESCGLGQDYDKIRTQINIDHQVYRILWQKATIIFAERNLLFGRVLLRSRKSATFWLKCGVSPCAAIRVWDLIGPKRLVPGIRVGEATFFKTDKQDIHPG